MGQGSDVAVRCSAGRRHSSDPTLLWLWSRPAAVAPAQSLAWKLPYVVGAAQKKKRKKKKSKQKKKEFMSDK